MATQIFVNLPVKDLNKSIEFFTSLGYSFNPQFTNEQGASLVISDNIFFMLLTEPFFKSFIKKEIADATKVAETINCISADSREEVDEIVRKAVAAGATVPNDKQDYGWMYGHGFQDLDGHLWEFAYMDMSAVPQQM
ncbi:VOC family protein [Mucilaginibacter lappiensis]|jgi:predicted lactoylglutathione lyase|uniref:VOC family protein n=1 Tax=Mucilaginibacter lappiensis TaxID=354630 RepID=UPI003D1D7578